MSNLALAVVALDDLRTIVSEAVRVELAAHRERTATPPEDANANDLLRTPDIQAMFGGISKVTVNTWVQTGKLPSVKIGGKRFFRRADVVNLLKTESKRQTLRSGLRKGW
jgi:excisionase family DNA binding protein